jgi:hypothetical protein
MAENEYANFGLPGVPAAQAVEPPPPRQRGWFRRNLWWLIPGAVVILVLPCGCCGGIILWGVRALKSSEPYQMALDRVRKDPRMIAELGEPMQETGWMPMGNINYNAGVGGTAGNATFDFNLSGPKGTAHVHFEAIYGNGKWSFRVLDATPSSTGQKISLLAEEKPAKAGKKGGAGGK